ncbi:MAG: Zn-ribbon domain-containing OB-fold protein [Actinobacteria bacterium]|nr:Zn-ribbon domain-containing OB-fold protein [Actinomycetota bacterium]
MTAPLPNMAPPINPDSKPFWDATAEDRLLLPRCDRCSTVIWYPREFCPACGSLDVSWFEASGRGSVYSFSIVRKGENMYTAAAPYVLAYVELEEGPRIMTNIVDCEVEEVAIGQAVSVVFHDTGQGQKLPRFAPV